jgi:cytochrome P450
LAYVHNAFLTSSRVMLKYHALERIRMTTPITTGDDIAGSPLPPLLPGLPVLGNALSISGDSRAFLLDAYRRWGPIFRVSALGQMMTVIVGPEANLFFSQMGSTYLRSKELWEAYADEQGADNLINAVDGEQHTYLRKIMKPGFSRATILPRIPDVVAVTRHVLAPLQPGQQIAVLPLLQRIITEQLGMLLTGRSPEPYIADIRLMVRYGLNVLVIRQWPRVALARPVYRRAKARVEQLAHAVIAEHRTTRESGRPRDLVDDLIEAHEADPSRFSMGDLLIGAIGPYIAGLDTVANTCTFLLYALLQNPDVLAKVQDEIDSVLAAKPLSAETIKDMPALHSAAMEAMRLYPVAPVMQRTATQPFTFAGHRVDAGTALLIGTGVTHLLPELFPQPERFDIGRYSPPRNEHRTRGAYAPFGLGAHTCLGAGLAEVQIAATMATLLHELHMTLPSGTRPRLRLDPTLTLGPQFKVQVIDRQSKHSTRSTSG